MKKAEYIQVRVPSGKYMNVTKASMNAVRFMKQEGRPKVLNSCCQAVLDLISAGF